MIRRARAAVAALIDRYTFVDWGHGFGVAFIADKNLPDERPEAGVGYALDDSDPASWPDGAALLTIGRLTLAAWLPRKGGAS